MKATFPPPPFAYALAMWAGYRAHAMRCNLESIPAMTSIEPYNDDNANHSSGMASEQLVNRMTGLIAQLQTQIIELPGVIADGVDNRVSTRLEAYTRRWDGNLARMQDTMHQEVNRLDSRIDNVNGEHDQLSAALATLATTVAGLAGAAAADFQPQFDVVATKLKNMLRTWFMLAMLALLILLIAGGLIFRR